MIQYSVILSVVYYNRNVLPTLQLHVVILIRKLSEVTISRRRKEKSLTLLRYTVLRKFSSTNTLKTIFSQENYNADEE